MDAIHAAAALNCTNLRLIKGIPGDPIANVLAAYNAGPANLIRWRRDEALRDDPLLFVESLPYRETRDFVRKVMTNLWLYRLRLGQSLASLDVLSGGRFLPGFGLGGVDPHEQQAFGVARGDDVELDGADALDRVDEEPRAAAAACGADGRQVEPIPVPEAVFRVIA